MPQQEKLNIHLLLRLGAGIEAHEKRGLTVDEKFEIGGIKGVWYAQILIRYLITEIKKRHNLHNISCIATFQSRPATSQLARLLALEIQRLTKQPVAVLVVARDGHNVTFTYREPSENSPDYVVELDRLRSKQAQELLRGREFLLFADVLKGERNEGIIHMLYYAASVRRTQAKIVGLAALLIQRGGIRALLRRATAERTIPVSFALHMRDVSRDEHPAAPASPAVRKGFARSLRRFLGGAAS